jgi:hypothetical protein
MFWQSLVVAEIFKFPMLNWFSKKQSHYANERFSNFQGKENLSASWDLNQQKPVFLF